MRTFLRLSIVLSVVAGCVSAETPAAQPSTPAAAAPTSTDPKQVEIPAAPTSETAASTSAKGAGSNVSPATPAAATPTPTPTAPPPAAPLEKAPEPKVETAPPRKIAPIVLQRTAPPADALSAKDREAIALVKEFEGRNEKPTLGAGGRLMFTYGATIPRIVCAPLRQVDIELQPGEKVQPHGVHFGDTVHWQADYALSGPADNQTTHVIVKPTDDNDRETNLFIGTDRRTYHLNVVASSNEWMPAVGFVYPEDVQKSWAQYEANVQQKKAANTIPETGEDISTLDFDYEIEGNAPWKPLRVYNNGVKTILQMPARMKVTEAPALLVIGDDDKEQLVNFRLRGDRYIVDSLFHKAVLVLGVGRRQTKVTITKIEK